MPRVLEADVQMIAARSAKMAPTGRAPSNGIYATCGSKALGNLRGRGTYVGTGVACCVCRVNVFIQTYMRVTRLRYYQDHCIDEGWSGIRENAKRIERTFSGLELIEVDNGEHDDDIVPDLALDEECQIVQFNTATISMPPLANPAHFHRLNLRVSVNSPRHEIIVRKASVLSQGGRICADLTTQEPEPICAAIPGCRFGRVYSPAHEVKGWVRWCSGCSKWYHKACMGRAEQPNIPVSDGPIFGGHGPTARDREFWAKVARLPIQRGPMPQVTDRGTLVYPVSHELLISAVRRVDSEIGCPPNARRWVLDTLEKMSRESDRADAALELKSAFNAAAVLADWYRCPVCSTSI